MARRWRRKIYRAACWLALGQHRGLPTRLLDWTYSPLVALHFATANLAHMNEDGVVWTINFVQANGFVPQRLRRIMLAEGSDTATVDMLSIFRSVGQFDRLSRKPRLARRVIIPASLKWEVRDKLDQANINERVLFPGLDGLSRWLTRYYWPKPAQQSASPHPRRRSPRRTQRTPGKHAK